MGRRGATVKRATQPIWVEAEGIRVAVVCFTAIVPKGFAVRANTPGVATLEHIFPTLAQIRLYADVLIVVPHWGWRVSTPHPPNRDE